MNPQTITINLAPSDNTKEKSKYQTKKEKRKAFFKENVSLLSDEFKSFISHAGQFILSTFKLIHYSLLVVGTLLLLLVMKENKNKNNTGFKI